MLTDGDALNAEELQVAELLLQGRELRHPTLAVELPEAVPDHAAEAVALACWAMGADTRPTVKV